jgi:hypothetical protein
LANELLVIYTLKNKHGRRHFIAQEIHSNNIEYNSKLLGSTAEKTFCLSSMRYIFSALWWQMLTLQGENYKESMLKRMTTQRINKKIKVH